MFLWWIYAAVTAPEAEAWWNPMHPSSLGTCLIQWSVALLLLISFNKNIAAASMRGQVDEA